MTTWTATDLGWTNRSQTWILLAGRDGDDLVVRRDDLPALLECLDRAGARYGCPRPGRGGRLARVRVGRVGPGTGYRLPTGATVHLQLVTTRSMAARAA